MDLSTTYMGLELKNPIVPSPSPLSEELGNIKRMEDAGAAAVVLFSVFEEQVKQEAETLERLTGLGADSFGEALSYFPSLPEFSVGPERYLELVGEACAAVDIPVIGSINGVSNDGWVQYAKAIQEAGASAIELNIYYIPTEMDRSGQEIEQLYLDVVKAVKAAVTVPVAVKLSPFFSAIANMAKQIDEAGADALVLFNRFYQPDFDLGKLAVLPSLDLSQSQEIRLPLLWISVLSGRVSASLAATTGVQTGQEVLKYLMAGADVAMTTSALLHHGIDHIGKLLDEMREWMEQNSYESVTQLKGSMSQEAVEDPTVFERANYVRILKGYE